MSGLMMVHNVAKFDLKSNSVPKENSKKLQENSPICEINLFVDFLWQKNSFGSRVYFPLETAGTSTDNCHLPRQPSNVLIFVCTYGNENFHYLSIHVWNDFCHNNSSFKVGCVWSCLWHCIMTFWAITNWPIIISLLPHQHSQFNRKSRP